MAYVEEKWTAVFFPTYPTENASLNILQEFASKNIQSKQYLQRDSDVSQQTDNMFNKLFSCFSKEKKPKKTIAISMDATLLSIASDDQVKFKIISMFLLQLSLNYNIIWLTMYPRNVIFPAITQIKQIQQALEMFEIVYYFAKRWVWPPTWPFKEHDTIFLVDSIEAEEHIREKSHGMVHMVNCDNLNLCNFCDTAKLLSMAQSMRQLSKNSTSAIASSMNKTLRTSSPEMPVSTRIDHRYAVIGLKDILVSRLHIRSVFGQKRVTFRARKGIQDLFAALQRHDYQIVVWSTEAKDVTDIILDKIDHSNAINFRLYKDSCAVAANKEGYARDLRIIQGSIVIGIGYDMDAFIFGEQSKEFICCNRYRGATGDCDLIKVVNLLDSNVCLSKPVQILSCGRSSKKETTIMLNMRHLLDKSAQKGGGALVVSPFASEILKDLVAKRYIVMVVSSEEERIVKPLLDALDPTGRLIRYRFYREDFGICLNNKYNINMEAFGYGQVIQVCSEGGLVLLTNLKRGRPGSYLKYVKHISIERNPCNPQVLFEADNFPRLPELHNSEAFYPIN